MNENLINSIVIIITLLFSFPTIKNIFVTNNSDLKGDKKVIITIATIFLSLVVSILIIMPVNFASESNSLIILYIYPIFVIGYLSIRFIGYIKNYIKITNSKNYDIYIRDIFVKYSPAVLSLLLNHNIEDKKDFDATVLNIHAKGVIKFENNDNRLIIVDMKEDKAVSKLTEDELYIYYVLIGKKKFDKDKWYNLIKKQLEKKKFVKKGKKNIIFQIAGICFKFFLFFIIILIISVLAMIIQSINYSSNNSIQKIFFDYLDLDIIVSIIWILCLLPLQLIALEGLMKLNRKQYLKDKLDYYTEKGALEILKWKKFKNFIIDYSMLENATVESVILWEKYIAYSMALNINKNYNSYELKELNKIIRENDLINL